MLDATAPHAAEPAEAAPRPWLNVSRFAQLRAAGRISEAGYIIGCAWRADYERIATLSFPQSDLERIAAHGGSGWSPPVGVLHAQRRLRQTRARIGDWERLLVDVLVDDRSWRSLGKTYGRRDDAVQDAIIALIEALEPIYAHSREPE